MKKGDVRFIFILLIVFSVVILSAFFVSSVVPIKYGQEITLKEEAHTFYLSANGEGTELDYGVNLNKDKVEHKDELFKLRKLNPDGTFAVGEGTVVNNGNYLDFVSVQTDKGLLYTSGRLWGNDWIHASGTKGSGGEGGTTFKVLIKKESGTAINCGDLVYFQEKEPNFWGNYKYLDIDFSKSHYPAKRGTGKNLFYIYESDGQCSCTSDTDCASQGKICSPAGRCIIPCTDACTINTKQCIGNGYQICAIDASTGCTNWGAVTNCVSGQTCSAGECMSADDIKFAQTISLKEVSKNKYLSSDNSGPLGSKCEINAINPAVEGDWEKFYIRELNADGTFANSADGTVITTGSYIDFVSLKETDSCNNNWKYKNNWIHSASYSAVSGSKSYKVVITKDSGSAGANIKCGDVVYFRELETNKYFDIDFGHSSGMNPSHRGDTKSITRFVIYEADGSCACTSNTNCPSGKCDLTTGRCEAVIPPVTPPTEPPVTPPTEPPVTPPAETTECPNPCSDSINSVGDQKCSGETTMKICTDMIETIPGCYSWVEVDCGAGKICTGSHPNALCADGEAEVVDEPDEPEDENEIVDGVVCTETDDSCTEEGKLECASDSAVKNCTKDNAGCLKWKNIPCLSNQVCSNSKCACIEGTTLCDDGTCSASCSTNATCNDNDRCDIGEGCNCPDCNNFQDSCAEGLVCNNGLCREGCANPCTEEEIDYARCIDGFESVIETCTQKSDSCFSWVESDCEAGLTCSGGVCVEYIPTCGISNPNCNEGENCVNCPGDCPCGEGQTCSTETGLCEGDIIPGCNNGICETGENCVNCPGDCPCDPSPYYFDSNPLTCFELDNPTKCGTSINWNNAIISAIEEHSSIFSGEKFCNNKKFTTEVENCDGYFKCGCYWDISSSRCLEHVRFTSLTSCTPQPPTECKTKTTTSGDCDVENEYTISWIAKWNGGGENETMGCTSGEKTLPCPPTESKIPFFTLTSLILTVISISLIYFIFSRKKK